MALSHIFILTNTVIISRKKIRLIKNRIFFAKILIKNADEIKKVKSPVEIAEIEIRETRTCPLIVVRPLPNNKEEHWDINELELLPDYD